MPNHTGSAENSIRAKLRAFVLDNFLFGQSPDFADGDSFIAMGILDSTGVLELVTFVETTFGIQVADHELEPAIMDSVDSLVRYIERKQATR